MSFKGHRLYDELVSLGIVQPTAVIPHYPHVRDRADVGVMRCLSSGVIFLSRIDHVDPTYYESQEGLTYWSKEGRQAGLKETWEDDQRRSLQLRDLVRGRSYVDVGTGLGGILDLLKGDVASIAAVEPQRSARASLESLGYITYANAAELAAGSQRTDVISLFHVFEHLTEPLRELRDLHDSLAADGTIVIEVPHARDALLEQYDLDAFKRFTYWSEHLVLHTRASLMKYLTAAGFTDIKVTGFQRYPLPNHLYWLKAGQPGGQKVWEHLRDDVAERAYEHLLDKLDLTDTLIAIARKRI